MKAIHTLAPIPRRGSCSSPGLRFLFALILCAPLLLPPSARGISPDRLFDFGDAPDEPYPTTLKQDGARHFFTSKATLHLGSALDAEQDAYIGSSGANGDDANPAGAPDDEDGILLGTVFIGQTAQVTVTASGTGLLQAWIDFNRDGDWADEGEQIFMDEALSAGSTVLSFSVPEKLEAVETFSRWRFSSSKGLKPTGPAEDGEVEDHFVQLSRPGEGLDFGDAPESYPTLLSQNGARHQVLQGFHLGPSVDIEPDGQPSPLADGDDLNPATAGPDENGVKFVEPLIPGKQAKIEVEARAPAGSNFGGRLDAWFDWNADGDWSDGGEQVFASEPLAIGVNSLVVNVPSGARSGQSFARFRYSQEGGLKPQDEGGFGEVEDHRVTFREPELELDFGDAPQQYPVLLGQNGACHRVSRSIFLGSRVDVERDGQPSPAATGDDASPSAADDEDGVRFLNQAALGGTVQVEVTSSMSELRLDAWVDFNQNGGWSEPGEQIFTGEVLVAGANSLSFSVPQDAALGGTFSRWRISFQGGLNPAGPASEGEVEDHSLRITGQQLDFGDAPQSYATLLADDGARHFRQDAFHLGELIDFEPDGQPSLLADGDDKNPPSPTGAAGAADDEDGIRFLTPLQPGEAAQVEVILTAAAATTISGWLDAWLDANANGVFDHPAEQIFNSRGLAPGANLLSFKVPEDAVPGATYARFRLSRQGSLLPKGIASDGEVEDYRAAITERPLPCIPRTHRGTNFWLAFPGNYAPDPDYPVRLTLCITGPRTTSGRVEIPGLGWSSNFVIGASMEIAIPLPPDAEMASLNDTAAYKGIHVTAEREVSVYGIDRVRYTTDGYLGLPTDVIGKEYILLGYGNEFKDVPDLNGTQFAFVATEDETRVTITPSVSTLDHPAGVPYTVFLEKAGYVYQLRNPAETNNDLSGTRISADKTISVFGSHQCAAIPSDDVFFCDYLVEQLLPVERAGRIFATASLASRDADTFRFTAIHDGTIVTVNGVASPPISAGRFYERTIAGNAFITANHPIFTVQYANSSDYDGNTYSDPFMMVVPPVTMFMNSYIVCTPRAIAPYPVFSTNYINIVAPTGLVGSISLDGGIIPVARFTPIPGSIYAAAKLLVDPGAHRLNAPDGAFGVSVYGWGVYDSYGFPGGMFFGDTIPPQIICPDKVTAVLPPNDPTRFTPCVTDVPDFRSQVQVRDNCDLRVSNVTQTPAPGTPVGPGVHVITFTAADSRGNVGTCQTVFEVIDPSPVEMICPEDIMIACTSPEGARVAFQATARQRCGTIPVTLNPPSGSVFPVGETTVTATAQVGDNTYTCQFKVIVTCGEGPRISFEISGNTITLNWAGGAVLEQAPTVRGPWIAVPNTDGSHTVDSSAGEQAFYRLRLN